MGQSTTFLLLPSLARKLPLHHCLQASPSLAFVFKRRLGPEIGPTAPLVDWPRLHQAVQGQLVEIGGFYYLDDALATAALHLGATFNGILGRGFPSLTSCRSTGPVPTLGWVPFECGTSLSIGSCLDFLSPSMNYPQKGRRQPEASNVRLPLGRRFTKGAGRIAQRMLCYAGCLGCLAPGILQAQQGSGEVSAAVVASEARPTPRSATWMNGDGSIIFGDGGYAMFGVNWWTIPRGALFAGFGELETNVFSHGRTEPGFVRLPAKSNWVWASRDPIGTLKVTGDFRQAAEGTLSMDVESPKRHDVLRVAGTAKLSGTLRVRWLGYRPRVGDRIPILKARRIVGRFTRVKASLPGPYTVEFSKVGGLGVLVVGRSSPRYPPPSSQRR